MTLTPAGCARLFRSARETPPAAWEGRHGCVNCPIGAAHAGLKIAPTAGAVRAMAIACPRCDQPASRLIRDRLCVSCYNRELEVRAGRNAKGNPPRLASVLRPGSVSMQDASGRRSIAFDYLGPKGEGEAIVILSKRATGPVAFGIVPPAAYAHALSRGPAVISGVRQTELCL